MTDATKGLRLVFDLGFTGLKFTASDGKYDEDQGPRDLHYINTLIESDERKRQRTENTKLLVSLRNTLCGYLAGIPSNDRARELVDEIDKLLGFMEVKKS